MKNNVLGIIVHSLNLRKLSKPAVLCIAALFVISMVSVLGANGVQAASTPALHTSGSKILDSNGNTVVFHGVDYSYFIDGPQGSWMLPSGQIEWNVWDTAAVNSNLDKLQSMGVNCVRVLATIQWWTQNTLVSKATYNILLLRQLRGESMLTLSSGESQVQMVSRLCLIRPTILAAS